VVIGEVLALGPDDPCRVVTLQKSVQIGGTIAANVFTLGTLDMAPCDFLYVHPTDDNARRWSKTKLKPMLKSLPRLARQFPEKSRDGGDSVLFKERVDGRGSILISGANSPASLSMVSMSRQVQDDLSKWEVNSAGDPEVQADSRSEAYQFAKIFKVSSPTVMPGCRITTNYRSGSQEELQVPCPHCGHYQTLEWGNMLAVTPEENPDDAHFTCIECGCEIREHHRRTWAGLERWVAHNPKAATYHRSFRLWGVYLPLQSWPQLFRRWLDAKGDPAREQVFTNDVTGLAWEVKGDAPPWEELRDRAKASPYRRGQVPAGALVFTMGIDCQKDRVEWQLIGWGTQGRRWVIEHGVVHYHIAEPEAREELDKLVTTRWRNAAGRDIGVDMAAIDGNAWTEEVWQWAKRHPSSKVIMVRGVAPDSAPLLARVMRERNPRTGKVLRYSRRFFNFATSVLKMALYRNVRKPDPEEFGFVGFPMDLEDDYFEQLTSESRVPKKRADPDAPGLPHRQYRRCGGYIPSRRWFSSGWEAATPARAKSIFHRKAAPCASFISICIIFGRRRPPFKSICNKYVV
jgi:phage terminase large subunit GpA-like protein